MKISSFRWKRGWNIVPFVLFNVEDPEIFAEFCFRITTPKNYYQIAFILVMDWWMAISWWWMFLFFGVHKSKQFYHCYNLFFIFQLYKKFFFFFQFIFNKPFLSKDPLNFIFNMFSNFEKLFSIIQSKKKLFFFQFFFFFLLESKKKNSLLVKKTKMKFFKSIKNSRFNFNHNLINYNQIRVYSNIEMETKVGVEDIIHNLEIINQKIDNCVEKFDIKKRVKFFFSILPTLFNRLI